VPIEAIALDMYARDLFEAFTTEFEIGEVLICYKILSDMGKDAGISTDSLIPVLIEANKLARSSTNEYHY